MSPSETSNKPESNLIARVCASISHHALIARGDKVIVGVSGGADSLTLLHVLCALRADLQFTIHLAHLNHQLRGADSQADADFVATLAREWQLDATIESRDVNALAQAEHLSIEEAARHTRYAFLAEVAQTQGASVIAAAHHRDDQVETVLMHWLRGSGLAGLRGINFKAQLPIPNLQDPRFASNLHLIRPLLDVTRTEIEKYLQDNKLTPRQDKSNFDTALFRNRLRHEVLPYLETLNPNLRDVLYHSAQSIADDYDFLNAAVESAFALVARESGGAIIFSREPWRALHSALQRGTLRAAVHRLRGNLRDVNWVHIEEARRVALEKNAGARATLPNGLILVVGYADFTISDDEHAAPLPDLPLLHVDEIAVPLQGITPLPDSDWVIETRVTKDKPAGDTDCWTATFDLEMCRGEIRLRRRRNGDRFQPLGMHGHSRSLHEYMIDEKIPRALRDLTPLLAIADRIAWVCGWRIDERARMTESTREFWQVTFQKTQGNRLREITE